MEFRARALTALAVVSALAACGDKDIAGSSADAFDAGGYGHVGVRDAASVVAPDAALNRMQAHNKDVLPSMRLVAVYFGDAKDVGAPSFDAFIEWLLASDYWGLMKQYGVSAGSLVGSVRIDADLVFPRGTVAKVLTTGAVNARVQALLHPEKGDSDGGSGDASTDGGGADARTEAPVGSSVIPKGDAYVFFLPDGVNASDGIGPGQNVTCINTGGYHSWAGDDPYAIIPPCAVGRSAQTISHELAEMATDPRKEGWFSNAEVSPAGGEIGDLCNQPVTVAGWSVTQLWSNQAGDCVPAF